MAAIDKIYVKNREQYLQFKEWCKKQPPFTDKYGKTARLIDYVYKHDENWDGGVAFMAPYYLDAYLIKNCPFDFIQKELMLNYGHWSQEKINDAYNCVMRRTEENKAFYNWLTPDDFAVVDDVITMPNLETSDYQLIKEDKLYNKPTTNKEYIVGKHFKCIKHPNTKFNTPFGIKNWWIDIVPPKELGYMWYHLEHNSWDFCEEFVIADWSSSAALCHTIKALKRLMLKWNLPVDTIVKATGRYAQETYEFIIKK